MPEDPGAGDEAGKIADAARQLLDEVANDPVPDRLIDLARQLEAAIAEKRKAAARDVR